MHPPELRPSVLPPEAAALRARPSLHKQAGSRGPQPPLSNRYAIRAGGRSQRTQAKRRICGLAALARLPALGPRQIHGPGVVHSTMEN